MSGNRFLGVYGVADPAGALRRLGGEPAWADGNVAFAGAPVWTDRSGEVVVSGELLLDNAAELRARLGAPDAAPGALLADLYRCEGVAGLSRPLGMFACALWDSTQRRLLLVRDGTGARTLYHATAAGGATWFAGQLAALRRTPAVSSQLSPAAIRDYLICAFVPGVQTMWQDAHELRPGTALALPDATLHTLWEPEEVPWHEEEPITAYAARLRPLLEETVRVRLPAAEPVAVLLSGGVDSSLVTALAARMAGGPVHSFAIHFGARYPNELAFSSMVAGHCATHHHVIELPARTVADTLIETMAALDDPIGDPLTVPNLLLARAAAGEARVLLNGEGGDPCFGGPKNLPMLLHEIYGDDAGRETAYLRSFQKCLDDLSTLLTPELQAALRETPAAEEQIAPYFQGGRMGHYLNQLMYLNVRMKGADQILTKVNNLTTAAGVLGRSPLFDRRMVEAAFAIPPHFKLEGTTEKAALKLAVADLLPAAIIERPKSGMLVPVQRWFRDELRGYARRLLLDRRARIRPYLNQAVVRDWLDYRGTIWPRHGVKLWLVLALEAWLRAQEH